MADNETILTSTETAVEETANGTWRESLPDDLKEAGSLKDMPDVGTLAKAYVDAQSYIGRSTRIPTEDASKEVWDDFRGKLTQVKGVGMIPTDESSSEEWSDFYTRMGRPNEPGEYKIDRPEGSEGNADIEMGLMIKAHELGLSNTQVSGLINWMNEGLSAAGSESSNVHEEALSSLKSDWGKAFDTKIKDARAAIATYGGDDLVRELNETGLGNNINLVKAFAEVGKGLGEDGAMNTGGSGNFKTTPAEALEQINQILGNASHPYNDDRHPQHNAEVDRVSRLYQAAYPSSDAETEFSKRLESVMSAG